MATSEPGLKTITISLPPDMAARAEALAKSEGRTISELAIVAFRDYMSEPFLKNMDDIRKYALTRNPHGYNEEDISALIKEAREEMAAEEAALNSAKAS